MHRKGWCFSGVVSALLKVEILKANHNLQEWLDEWLEVVSALLKVEILKANHNVDRNKKEGEELYLHYLK